METPLAEFPIDEPLARALLREQHPDLADEPLRFVASGWDNVIYRLGEEYAVRLPRRALGASLVEKEQRWMPEFALRLTVAIPAPVRVGVPSADFPWHWSITRWLDGDLAQAGSSAGLISDLALFIRQLHIPAPDDAPRSPVRGVSLARRDEVIRARLASEPIPRRADIVDLWSRCVAAEPWSGTPLWLHGDLHPSNILTASGHLTAVLDFGDLAAGDPATDLAVAWLLFDGSERKAFRSELDYDEATWLRAAGWAIIFASLALGGEPAFRAFARHAFRELLSE
jgi:aminoglycoside phosphotransferase (APT) family kinase protein